jgi:YVTN family beta-propeller protein
MRDPFQFPRIPEQFSNEMPVGGVRPSKITDDARTGRVVGRIAVHSDVTSLAVTPDGRELYVGSRGNGSVQVIDTSTRKAVADIPGSPVPWQILFLQ